MIKITSLKTLKEEVKRQIHPIKKVPLAVHFNFVDRHSFGGFNIVFSQINSVFQEEYNLWVKETTGVELTIEESSKQYSCEMAIINAHNAIYYLYIKEKKDHISLCINADIDESLLYQAYGDIIKSPAIQTMFEKRQLEKQTENHKLNKIRVVVL